jgi:hypothetical protein
MDEDVTQAAPSRVSAVRGWSSGRIALAITLLLLPIYLATASYDVFQSNDPRSVAYAGFSLASTGSLAFDEDWPRGSMSWAFLGEDDRRYSNRFPGSIVVAAVAYTVAGAVGAVDLTPVPHPHLVPFWPPTVAAVLIAAAAVGLTFLLLSRLDISRRAALFATLVIGVASPVWSVSADALWTHGQTHLLLVLVLLAIIDDRPIVAGLATAFAIFVRPHLVVPLAVLAFAGTDRRTRWSILGSCGVGLGAVAWYSYTIFGQPLPAAGYPLGTLRERWPIGSVRGMAENLGLWLAQPLRGVAFYAPLSLLALVTVPRVWSEAPRWVRVSALAGVAYAAVQLSLIRSTGGNFFYGHRTTIETLVLAAPLLTLALVRGWRDNRILRGAIATLAAISFVVHAYGAIMDMPPYARARMQESIEESGPDAVDP